MLSIQRGMAKNKILKTLFFLTPLLVTNPVTAAGRNIIRTVNYIDETAIQKASVWDGAKPASRGGRQFVETVMAAHNGLRQSMGLSQLTWDPALAAHAAEYAAQMAQTRRFEHSADLPRVTQGENLWMGTRSAYSYSEMLASWSEEGADFKQGSFPQVSKTGSWHDVGHYTHMMWGGSRRVGCAVASNTNDDFLVCRYFPAGNVYGADPFAQNFPFAQNIRAVNLANAFAR